MSPTARPRTRMTGVQRRLQLIDISRHLFSLRGVDGTTIEEIARAAGVSKPVVYEHFGSKEALYMEVVTNEYRELLHRITESLSGEEDSSRVLLEKAALAMLTYIEECTEGFRILVRDAPPSQPEGTYSTLLTKVTEQVEHILADEFTHRGFSAEDGSIYAQMLVGMVAMTAQWWLDARHPDKRTVAAHVVNLAWYGLTGLRKEPGLREGQAGPQ
ncbi:TetR/AcrR family transcriptional regulator [Paeniglutamicibacter psychrophenolicus]|uniref:TetR/AcrR family transcriptional regulator n=1 Tax=Paeniglutamicibacter psychrophenolicus TaxID=257454 RepID=UPI00278AB4F9|nr:TetR/AcrR family transcriptional regulator [Paeniglutamicibacter psychrophenolicus]MDQ0092668.1 AcrR family transcriptional regulator [Paeniglutamicibacter psychrophenolicus]